MLRVPDKPYPTTGELAEIAVRAQQRGDELCAAYAGGGAVNLGDLGCVDAIAGVGAAGEPRLALWFEEASPGEQLLLSYLREGLRAAFPEYEYIDVTLAW